MSYELFPGVYRVQYGISDYGANIGGYFIVDRSIALIDAGLHERSLDVATKFLEEDIGRSPSEVEFIFLTHAHPEQIMGLHKAKDYFPNATILAHESLAPKLAKPRRFLKNEAFFLSGLELKELHKLANKVPRLLEVEGIKGTKKIPLGGRSILPVTVHGHSIGHTMYFESSSKVLFIGDALNATANDPLGIIIDASGTIKDVEKTLDFFSKASYHALCPAGDEPNLSQAKAWAIQVRDSFQNIFIKGTVAIIKDGYDNLEDIRIQFEDRFGPGHSGAQGKELLSLTLARILEHLVSSKLIIRNGNSWEDYVFRVNQ